MRVTLAFGDDETLDARHALNADRYLGCLRDLADMMRKATHDEPWAAGRIYEEFWRICNEDWNIDPYEEDGA